jgi:hypothetical protein
MVTLDCLANIEGKNKSETSVLQFGECRLVVIGTVWMTFENVVYICIYICVCVCVCVCVYIYIYIYISIIYLYIPMYTYILLLS